MGSEDIMAPKAHGTCTQPVQSDLRFGCDTKTADKICCFNRHYAEHSGYAWGTSWTKELPEEPIDYYDSVSGKQLFRAPVGRTRPSSSRSPRPTAGRRLEMPRSTGSTCAFWGTARPCPSTELI